MKLVHPLIDEPALTVVTTFAEDADVPEYVEGIVGKGNPFYAFESIPPEIEGNIAADFNGAPLCSNKVDENRAAIDAMLDNPPLDKLSQA
ncbi:MAG TPA: hypothetical protein VGU45_04955 [Microvirga sp.]|jgi:hypothetical protein|nr:hypothetical protein [Microvirga sp.]